MKNRLVIRGTRFIGTHTFLLLLEKGSNIHVID